MESDKTGTTIFVELVTRLIYILNVKSPDLVYRLDYPDRKVFEDIDDKRFEFLLNMSQMFAKICPKCLQKICPKCLQKICPKCLQKICPKCLQKICPKCLQKYVPNVCIKYVPNVCKNEC